MGIGASRPIKPQASIVVTLDALSTLYKFREPITTQYIKVAQRCGMTAHVQESDLKQVFKQVFKDLSAEYPNFGKKQLSSPRAWWMTLVNDAFRQVVDEKEIPDHLGEELFNHFTSSAAYELYDDVKPFLRSMRELKDQGIGEHGPHLFIAVVSNSDPRVKSVLQSLGLRVGPEKPNKPTDAMPRWSKMVRGDHDAFQMFWHNTFHPLNDIDFLVTSYTSGYEKPSRFIFAYAHNLAVTSYLSKVDQSQEQPSVQARMAEMSKVGARMKAFDRDTRFVHIGDDYEKDYAGAKDAGWEALHLVREEDGQTAREGADTVYNLEQAATAIRIVFEQEKERVRKLAE